jgi:hypothetical protein
MKLEVGKEYLYKGNKVKLVYVGQRGDCNLLVVCQLPDWAKEEWVSAEELSSYHDFKRGEPVVVIDALTGVELRRYFSHVNPDGELFCFINGATVWSGDENTTPWGLIRKLTPEEQKEYDKCK